MWVRNKANPARLRRSRLTDPRLIIGILLVCASVALGAVVVGKATSKTSYLMLTQTVEQGKVITKDMVRAVPVNLGEAEDSYVRTLEENTIASRSIKAGELLSVNAIAAKGELELRRVMVPVRGELPQTALVGSQVELWKLPDAGSSTLRERQTEPEKVAEGLVIARLPESGGGLGRLPAANSVELVVPEQSLQTVLAAVSAPGGLTLVPTGAGE